MKITLSFPSIGNEAKPEAVVDVPMIPRKGELLSWNGSLNFFVTDVVHIFSGDNGSVYRVEVHLRN